MKKKKDNSVWVVSEISVGVSNFEEKEICVIVYENYDDAKKFFEKRRMEKENRYSALEIEYECYYSKRPYEEKYQIKRTNTTIAYFTTIKLSYEGILQPQGK